MSKTPLVDAYVVGCGTPDPWIHAETARGIEIQLREEIAALKAKVNRLELAGEVMATWAPLDRVILWTQAKGQP